MLCTTIASRINHNRHEYSVAPNQINRRRKPITVTGKRWCVHFRLGERWMVVLFVCHYSKRSLPDDTCVGVQLRRGDGENVFQFRVRNTYVRQVFHVRRRVLQAAERATAERSIHANRIRWIWTKLVRTYGWRGWTHASARAFHK